MSGCEEVREILVATARAELVSAPGQRFLRDHVETCTECRRRLANERMLSAGLTAVASTMADVPAPEIKAALLREFRRKQVAVPIRRPVVKWAAIAAVAAALLLAIFVAVGRRAAPVGLPDRVPVAKAPAPVVAPAAERVANAPVLELPVKKPERKVVARAKPPAIRHAPAATAEEPGEVATDFFEIPYAQPLRPEERADVYRIQMPRANMAVFGLPVTGGRLDSRVTADVLLGEDGVVRAVRFIR